MSYKIVCQVVSGRNTYWKYGTMVRVLDATDQSADDPKVYDLHCTLCVYEKPHSLNYHMAQVQEAKVITKPSRDQTKTIKTQESQEGSNSTQQE